MIWYFLLYVVFDIPVSSSVYVMDVTDESCMFCFHLLSRR